MRFWLIVMLLGILGLLWFYRNSKQSFFLSPINFQKPIESLPEKPKEKIWLEAKLINPQRLSSDSYYFKIFGEKSSYQTETFIVKDIRLYRQNGERIIQNKFFLPENLGDIKKISLAKGEKEILSESNPTFSGNFILADKDRASLLEISISKENGYNLR